MSCGHILLLLSLEFGLPSLFPVGLSVPMPSLGALQVFSVACPCCCASVVNPTESSGDLIEIFGL